MRVRTDIHALVQAGGQGERIRAVAGALPKPLMNLGAMPILERLLRRIVDCGIRRVSVVVGVRGDAVAQHVKELKRDLPSGVQISVEHEALPAGNAGALGMVDFANRSVLLCFADLVTRFDFARFAEIHRERGCDVTLASHLEGHQLSLGELVTSGRRVREYREKPLKQFLICSGIALFEPRVIEVARGLPRPFGLVDIVNGAISAGCEVTHWEHGSYWIDVNTPELLERARKDIAAGA